jgi:hypothetical protein
LLENDEPLTPDGEEQGEEEIEDQNQSFLTTVHEVSSAYEQSSFDK